MNWNAAAGMARPLPGTTARSGGRRSSFRREVRAAPTTRTMRQSSAISILERLREVLGEDWPVPWRNDLAGAYVNRGVAKRSAPGQGALAAIGDYDAAIAIMERLREVLGED